jgi:hypothetical protein
LVEVAIGSDNALRSTAASLPPGAKIVRGAKAALGALLFSVVFIMFLIEHTRHTTN